MVTLRLEKPVMSPQYPWSPPSGDTGFCRAVNNHWTGLLDWTTGLDYWTDQFTKFILGLNTPAC